MFGSLFIWKVKPKNSGHFESRQDGVPQSCLFLDEVKQWSHFSASLLLWTAVYGAENPA